jgi:multidrug transporter EmrE-like cation transporter
MSYLDIGLLILTEIVGDFGYKKFADKGGVNNFAMGTIGYVGVVYFLIRSLQGSQVLLVNAVWDGLSALIESIAAMVVLGERFTDPKKYLGIILIIIGLFFLKLPVVSEHKFVFPKFFESSLDNFTNILGEHLAKKKKDC